MLLPLGTRFELGRLVIGKRVFSSMGQVPKFHAGQLMHNSTRLRLFQIVHCYTDWGRTNCGRLGGYKAISAPPSSLIFPRQQHCPSI